MTAATTWGRLRAAYDQLAADLPEEATSEQLDAYLSAWAAAMLAEADSVEGIRWKIEQLVKESVENGEWRDDLAEVYTAAIIADAQRPILSFAEAWLSAWTKAGGSVVIDDEGEAHFGYPTYDLAPNCVQCNPDLPSELNENAFLHAQADYYATMRERFNLLKALPCGADAIKAHMRAKGIRVAVLTTEQGK